MLKTFVDLIDPLWIDVSQTVKLKISLIQHYRSNKYLISFRMFHKYSNQDKYLPSKDGFYMDLGLLFKNLVIIKDYIYRCIGYRNEHTSDSKIELVA